MDEYFIDLASTRLVGAFDDFKTVCVFECDEIMLFLTTKSEAFL